VKKECCARISIGNKEQVMIKLGEVIKNIVENMEEK